MREDTPALRSTLERVRKLVLQGGAKISGARIKRLLDKASLVPNQVIIYQ